MFTNYNKGLIGKCNCTCIHIMLKCSGIYCRVVVYNSSITNIATELNFKNRVSTEIMETHLDLPLQLIRP